MAKNNLSQWSLTLLRVVLGFIFTYHGYLKLFATGGFVGTAGFLTALKIPFPLYSALLIAVVEFFGGIFLILGMVTKWSTILLFIEMLVAFFKVHLKNGLLISQTAYGYEFVLLILVSLVVVLANGAGKLSMGKLFKKKYLQ